MISLAPSRLNPQMDELSVCPQVPFPPVEAYAVEGIDSPVAKAYMENLYHLEDELLALRSRVRDLGRSATGKTQNDVRSLVTLRKLVATGLEVLG